MQNFHVRDCFSLWQYFCMVQFFFQYLYNMKFRFFLNIFCLALLEVKGLINQRCYEN